MRSGPTKRNSSSTWINIWLHFTVPNTNSLPQRLMWSILTSLYCCISSSCWQRGCSCPVQDIWHDHIEITQFALVHLDHEMMSPWSLPQKLSWDSNPSWNLSPVLLFLKICWPLCPAWAAAWKTSLYAGLYLTMTVPSWYSPFPHCFNLYFQPTHSRWFVFYQKSPWCCNLGEEGGGERLFPHWHLLSSFSCFHASFHVTLSQTGVVMTCQSTPRCGSCPKYH